MRLVELQSKFCHMSKILLVFENVNMNVDIR